MPVENNVDFSTFSVYNSFYLGGVEGHLSMEASDVYEIRCITCYKCFDPNIDIHKYLSVGEKR